MTHPDAFATLAILRREMQARHGMVSPSALPTEGRLIDGSWFSLSRDGALLGTPEGARLFYRKGEGVTIDSPDDLHEDDVAIWLWGTMFGAVAWLNGLFALHASAVSDVGDRTGLGRVIAFTADSGGGKSTLAAALCGHGYRHFCDDTLVLMPESEPVTALPDGKRLKLWDDALALADAKRLGEIRAVPGKYFAQVGNACDQPGVLTDLFFLEPGDALRITPITGSAKFAALVSALYREYIPVALAGQEAHSRHMLNIVRNVRFWRLERPKTAPHDREAFDSVTARIAEAIHDLPTASSPC